jgi:type IV pilus assembly protein PilQ
MLEPLHSELIQINYGKAAGIEALLRGSGQSVLSNRGTVSVDERTNTLWVQDTLEKLAEIKRLVKRLDIPVRQVLIEAKIVNIDEKYAKELGIRWGVSIPQDSISGTLEGAGELANDTTINKVNVAKRLNIDLPAVGVGAAGGAASIGVALAKLGKGVLLDLELSALQTTGDAKIIASPRLITANQKDAIIESGEEIPYQEAASSGATAVTFKKAVLSLKVTPQITPDNRVILSLKVNQDKPGPDAGLGVPSIDTREIQTQVLVNDGQTIVLGGIFQKAISNTIERVPFLSDIPVIGHLLFQHTVRATRQTELLIFVTPKIIRQSFYKQ